MEARVVREGGPCGGDTSASVAQSHTHTNLHPSHGGHCGRYPKKLPSQQTDPGFQTQALDGGRDEGETCEEGAQAPGKGRCARVYAGTNNTETG